jgi:H/ACA ribonucleoprotein complex subunit 3
MEIYINGQRLRVKPAQAIGKGGEADVFDIGQGRALKLFKSPNHPDYQGLPQEQQAAGDRLNLHQQKLRQFPANLPQRVIAPEALATDKTGQRILGYRMPLLQGAEVLLKYGDRAFRQGSISQQTVVRIFQDLHDTLSKLHFAGVVIGDFNDLNVLVRGTEAYIIDADSFQFGTFPCQVFTARFVDPLLCNPQANQPILQQSHHFNSDWYAFAVMVMQGLLFVDPYGGVYKPKDVSQQVPQMARSLHRITIFHPEVRYPKPAIPYRVLPDELLHYFHQVFERDVRGEFPRSLLDNLHWTTCTTCGTEHGRSTCPNCTQALISPVATQVITAEQKITATRVFHTDGVILFATVEQGQLRWLYRDRDQFRREDGSVVIRGEASPQLRWRIQGRNTILGYQGQLVTFHPDQPPQRIAVDTVNNQAAFDVNASHLYWIHNGQLLSNQNSSQLLITDYQLPITHSPIGNVLVRQTQFWIGSHFGFGFYRAGDLRVAFVFDAEKPGINDRVRLPLLQGQLIHTTCTFSTDVCWILFTLQQQGQIHYQCVVICSTGEVLAMAEAVAGEEHWLAKLGQGGAIAHSPYCATGNFLLAATDEGIVRIERQSGQLRQTKLFPETEPFVTSQSQLLAAPQGLYVVNPQEIVQLQIS